MPKAVIAIGGNSLIKDKEHQTVEDQYVAAGETDGYSMRRGIILFYLGSTAPIKCDGTIGLNTAYFSLAIRLTPKIKPMMTTIKVAIKSMSLSLRRKSAPTPASTNRMIIVKYCIHASC